MQDQQAAVSLQQISEEDAQKTLRRVTFTSFLGNFIEWLDYASYSYFATVIALVFFPEVDKTVGAMYTFAVFALAFLVRPVGAIFWGTMGDRKGRKWALATAIIMMSGATFLIGCLPGYQTVGLLAPILLLLCRIVQSFSASGEYAGAATFIAEYAPKDHRGFYCSMVPASTAVGLLMGSLFATLMFSVWGASSQFVTEWGWRLPFLIAGPLGLLAHYVCERLNDSPIYEAMRKNLEAKGTSQGGQPIRTLLTKHTKKVILAFGACVLNAVGFYTVLTYMPNYLEVTLNYDSASASLITTLGLALYIGFVFISGRISDRVGRRKMLLAACIGFIVFTVPAFMLMGTKDFWTILIVEWILCLILTINDGTLSSYLTETFPTEVRFSGFALSFNMANALFGGSASYISFMLIQASGNPIAPAFYMVAIGVVALIAMLFSHEHTGRDLGEV